MRVLRRLLFTVAAPLLTVALLGTAVVFWPREAAERPADLGGGAPAAQPGPAWLERRAGVETELVAYRELFKEVRTVGKIDYNERRVAYITARIDGRVDRLYADFTGLHVKPGDHLVEIYSPDLVSTAQNLLDAPRESDKQLARDRLRLWGLTPEQIKEIERSGEVPVHLTVYAPLGGTVIEKAVRTGQYVKQGDLLYRTADLDPVWLYLDVYEYDLGWVRYGQKVEVTVEAFPGETFRGTVVFIDPFLDDKTRTIKVRVNLPNPERKLKPAMYASASIRVRLRADGGPEPTGLEGKYVCPMHPEVVRDGPGSCPVCGMALERVPDGGPKAAAGHEGHGHEGHEGHAHDAPPPDGSNVLAVRASAVLDTGRRQVAYRQNGEGNYELVELKLGPRAEAEESGKRVAYFPVLAGLSPGDRVAVRGGFLLDSQAQIEGRPSLLYPEGLSAANLHAGHGGTAPQPKPSSPGGGHKH